MSAFNHVSVSLPRRIPVGLNNIGSFLRRFRQGLNIEFDMAAYESWMATTFPAMTAEAVMQEPVEAVIQGQVEGEVRL